MQSTNKINKTNDTFDTLAFVRACDQNIWHSLLTRFNNLSDVYQVIGVIVKGGPGTGHVSAMDYYLYKLVHLTSNDNNNYYNFKKEIKYVVCAIADDVFVIDKVHCTVARYARA